jgi:hypothetical protein
MGCNCSREEAKIIANQKTSHQSKNLFIIKIHIPGTEKLRIAMHEGRQDRMLLADVLNNICFCSHSAMELDANFISVYNHENDRFDYYIQRLISIEMENETNPEMGKMWVPYINNLRYSWTYLCHNNRVIKKGDEVELKFEFWNDTSG